MRLRPIIDCAEEHEWLLSLHNDPEVLRYITYPHHVTMDEHMAWFKRTKDSNVFEAFVFEANDTRVGIVKFYQIDKDNHNCGLGANIHKEQRGKGYAKPMWNLMLERCFDVHQCHRVWLTTADFNAIGQKVYRSLGFQEEGRLVQSLYRDGVYYDQISMYMLQEMWKRQ